MMTPIDYIATRLLELQAEATAHFHDLQTVLSKFGTKLDTESVYFDRIGGNCELLHLVFDLYDFPRNSERVINREWMINAFTHNPYPIPKFLNLIKKEAAEIRSTN